MRSVGGRLVEMSEIFQRAYSTISRICTQTMVWLYDTYAAPCVKEFRHNVFDYFRLRAYKKVLTEKGFPVPHVFGFVDGTFHPILRPCNAEEDYDAQRDFYSKYKKGHGVQYEIISFPDGMVGRAYGPLEGRKNDLNLAHNGGLVALVRNINERYMCHRITNGEHFAVFGDSIYACLPHLYVKDIQTMARAHSTYGDGETEDGESNT